jgi:diguanylate cyclase (GGDEF)-like protein
MDDDGPSDRRPVGRVAARLMRQIADDDERAAFWVRHVRIGVVQSELAGMVAAVYALADPRSATPKPWLLSLAAVVMVGSPALLMLPVVRIVRSRYGSLFFYLWSLTVTAFVALAASLDGGAASPMVILLFLTLTYAGMAYPPLGVALMGGVMITAYLAVAAEGRPPGDQLFLTTGVLALFTFMSVWISLNQWRDYERQQILAGRLRALATRDPLTGCPNRAETRARLAALAAQASPQNPLTVCVLDLDGFKQVNDRHGHQAGDELLARVAAALQSAVRQGDVVGRIGGDEFVVLLPGAGATCAEDLVQRLLDSVRGAGTAHGVTASVGTIRVLAPATEVDALLDAADRAMYGAKRRRSGTALHLAL